MFFFFANFRWKHFCGTSSKHSGTKVPQISQPFRQLPRIHAMITKIMMRMTMMIKREWNRKVIFNPYFAISTCCEFLGTSKSGENSLLLFLRTYISSIFVAYFCLLFSEMYSKCRRNTFCFTMYFGSHATYTICCGRESGRLKNFL